MSVDELMCFSPGAGVLIRGTRRLLLASVPVMSDDELVALPLEVLHTAHSTAHRLRNELELAAVPDAMLTAMHAIVCRLARASQTKEEKVNWVNW